MPTICAIIACPEGLSSAQEVLHTLCRMTRKPDCTILLTSGLIQSDKRISYCKEYASINLSFSDATAIDSWEKAFSFAFDRLQADYVWLLDTACRVSATALDFLVRNTAPETPMVIPVSLLTDSDNSEKLSQPVLIESGKSLFAPWKSILNKKDLPDAQVIPLRGAWIGALYPRPAYNRLGNPIEKLTLINDNEEYAWKAKLAGFRFVLRLDSSISHPSFSHRLLHYNIAGRSFFYEPGLTPQLQYYKMRNWAWIQRLRKPQKPVLRLVFCGLYIILALNAMLKSNELSIRNAYNMFRALHNGFYGKLRPYSSEKN